MSVANKNYLSNILSSIQNQDLGDGKYCYLPTADQQFCMTQQVSVLLFLALSLCFLYQVVFVWMRSFQYSARHERRVQIMIGCVLYCMRKLKDDSLIILTDNQ